MLSPTPPDISSESVGRNRSGGVGKLFLLEVRTKSIGSVGGYLTGGVGDKVPVWRCGEVCSVSKFPHTSEQKFVQRCGRNCPAGLAVVCHRSEINDSLLSRS